MTFDAKESSQELGRPVELYLFELDGTFYGYVRGASAVEVDGITYEPEAVSRTRLVSESERRGQDLTVFLPGDNEFARLYVDLIPGEEPQFTLYQYHVGDAQVVTLYSGLVHDVSFTENRRKGAVVVRPLTSAGKQPMPRDTFQSVCNHMLYGPDCRLLEADFQEFGEVTDASGRTVTMTGVSNLGAMSDYWEAGFIQHGQEKRLVVGQAGAVLTLNLPFRNSPIGQTVRILPGCKGRKVPDCHVKFDNVLNFGGTDHVPRKNPFETGLD